MFDFFKHIQLSDGWTIYIWLITGGLILIAVVIGLRWAAKNDQFDEDIKYLVFDENDKDKMDPEEFAKYQEVIKEQEKKRKEFLARKAEEQARKHAA